MRERERERERVVLDIILGGNIVVDKDQLSTIHFFIN